MNKREIDFITEGYAFEVKYQNRIINDDLKEISAFKGKKYIISKNDLTYIKQRDVSVVPVEIFLLLTI